MSSAARPTLHAARADAIRALATTPFDLLVVGGGATGCGVARDAALRGLAVALVEKDDVASGTSSRSSRLIHGGVRYLEHGHVALVYESSRERRRLLDLAPHLVRPLAFTWPVYAGARVPRWKLVAGLALYDALALFRNAGRHERLSAGEVLAREPAVRRDGLTGGAAYWDAATDDARLTLATALDAARAGAVVVNHAAVIGLARTTSPAGTRVTVRDQLGGDELAAQARVVVNATGPWTDVVRRLDGTVVGDVVRGSKGVHVAVPRERLGNRQALTLTAPRDGRVFFALPAGTHAIIGTTDTYTTASPDEVRASESDVAYLIEAANAYFPAARLARDDVVSAWAGIRPLVAAPGDDTPQRASREHAITRSAAGVVTVTGGKLTTYRAMAAQVVDVVEGALGRRRSRSPTERRPLPGGAIASVDMEVASARRESGLDGDVCRQLVHAYGSDWRAVLAECDDTPDGRARLVPSLPYVRGELRWAVRHELACTLGDLLVRRTKVAFETRDHGRAAAREAAAVVAPLLGWDDARVVAETARYEQEAARLFGVDA